MVFTRDLRLADNSALAAAARAPAMVPLFVLDEAILRRASAHANRLGFLLDSLRDLDSGLRNAGGALVLRAGPWAETVLATAQAAGAGRIHVADDVSGYATSRLGQLERDATGARVTVVRHPGITAVEPAAVRHIRRWVPELAGLPAPDIHDPGPAARRARGYPEPIVDHRQAMAAHRARRAGR
jgi:deoxyribodipyrimidine photo-lyase